MLATTEREKIFVLVFNILLDYNDSTLREKCARWGLDAFKSIERQGKVITTINVSEQGVWFMYAATSAVILREFSKISFNDYHLADGGEQEIKLEELGLRFEEVEGWLDDEIKNERREELRKGNFITLADVWETIQEFKRVIFQALFATHVESGVKHPADAVFASLAAIFEEMDADGTVMSPFHGNAGEMSAYSYVTNAFQY